MLTKEISEKLAVEGYSLRVLGCTNPGSHNEPSEWRLQVERSKQAFEVPSYFRGAAFRRWKKGAKLAAQHRTDNAHIHFRKFIEDEERVPAGAIAMLSKLKQDSSANASLFGFFAEWTKPEEPSLADVMHCLVMDAGCVRHGQNFLEFCNEFGCYDTDSRKAERAFNTCRDEWAGLVRLGADFDALEVLFVDY